MRLFLKIAAFSILCSLFIITVNAQNITQNAPKSASSASQELKIDFPDIEGWEKSEITRYPNAELGYNINYKSEDAGLVSIYVYNMGLREIPNDLNHRILIEEMAGVKAAVQTYGNMGYYTDIKELKNETVVLGGKDGKMKALKSVFTYNLQGRPVISEAYILGHKNHFIKVRATYPKVEGETENKALADLLLKLESLLAA
jgi:hypothetical protein